MEIMNDAVLKLYDTYLKYTSNNAVAASLTLADLMQRTLLAKTAEPMAKPAAEPAEATDNRPMMVPEVAKFLRVRPDKVLSWIRSGRLRGYNVAEHETGRPKYRVNPEDLEAFMLMRVPIQPTPRGRPVGRHIRRIPKPNWKPKSERQ